jgi:hypothetical protein
MEQGGNTMNRKFYPVMPVAGGTSLFELVIPVRLVISAGGYLNQADAC